MIFPPPLREGGLRGRVDYIPKESYEAVIGLEIHVELNTESKMFCACPVSFGEKPNTQVCPVCLGHPGVLPVLNGKAVEHATLIGLSLNCEVTEFCQFHRKNYFYPDMPKDYQISQYDLPLCVEGYLEVGEEKGVSRIGITRVHMEEDTGKLIHIGGSGRIHGADYSLVDFNRAGVPLIEIVSEPDIRSPEEARMFMQKLRSIILTLGVSDCNMEEGSMRCDANVSVRPVGRKEFGTKTEVKNINSFRSVQRALQHELDRHIDTIDSGDRVVQETRHWDDAGGVTTSLRSKEEAHDYRYFPEPDLVPLISDKPKVERMKKALPELPDARRVRLMEQYGLPKHDANVISLSKATGDFFEEVMETYEDTRKVSNWILVELGALLNQANLEIDECAVTPRHLIDLLKLMDKGTISGKMAKDIFKESFDTGKLPSVIVEDKGLVQLTDEDAIGKIVEQVLAENPKAIEDYKNGQERVVGFLVGQVMRLTQGKASPDAVNRILKHHLK